MLRSEVTRLRVTENIWSSVKASCPRLDTQIRRGPHRKIEAIDGAVDESNGYSQLAYFRGKWSYSRSEMFDDVSGTVRYDIESTRERTTRSPASGFYPSTQWGSGDFHLSDNDTGIELCPKRISSRHLYCFCRQRHTDIASEISSQLLLYRLVAAFGMPPPISIDQYKACWEIRLTHSDGRSDLTFYDYAGAPKITFFGRIDASDDAIQFLRFLTGLNFPHPYSGIVAGTAASAIF